MTKELKFVEGGWYETRNGLDVYKITPRDGQEPYVWGCGNQSWRKNGMFLIGEKESGMDLVRRVMPPVDYVAVKKWLWEADAEYAGQIIGTIRTNKYFEKEPFFDGFVRLSWRKVEGSEVEE
jgi:hypothetical protein